MAAFPEDVSDVYLRQILFPAFWPVSKGSTRTSPLAWCMKATYFAIFLAMGFELALRGLIGRPLRSVSWAGFTDRLAPALPGDHDGAKPDLRPGGPEKVR
jgi:hypothetical protein